MRVAELLKKIGWIILALVILNGGLMYFFIHSAEDDARVVNYTGIVRGLSQRVLKLDYAGKYSEATPYAVQIEQIIIGLQNGDQSLNLKKLDDDQFQLLMKNVYSSWGNLKTTIEYTKRQPEAFSGLLSESEDFFVISDRAVNAAENAAKNRIIFAEVMQLILILLQLVALYFLRLVTKERVLKPLNIIMEIFPKAAKGDLEQRLPMRSKDEFGEIATVFNQLISRQDAVTEELDKKVKEKTRQLEIRVQEVAEEKIEVEKLLSENEKFKLAVAGTSDHVIIADSSGILIYANRAAEKITGFSFAEMKGIKAGVLWGGQMDKEFYERMWHTISVEIKPFKGRLKNKRKNGELYDAEVSISPILDKQGKPIFYVGLERDITEEVAVDRAKTEFVSVASHQLRTPLTAVNWYTELLKSAKTGKLNKKQDEYVTEISESNKRMTVLVNNLLNVSRLDLGTFPVFPEEKNVCEILTDVVKEILPQTTKKNIKLNLSCSAKTIKMMVDVSLIRFIFQNLITNAVKYTPEKGSVKVGINKDNKNVIITVSDSGMGIPLKDQKNIFSKFFRASNVENKDTDGTGLGLYIVKSVLDFIGGKIWFESTEGVGTKFIVNLPLTGMVARSSNKK